jgi:biopolymer transport protein ExbB/TolQ
LKNQGITAGEILKASIGETLKVQAFGVKKYYKDLTEIESDALDLTKPFRLYTNSIRLSTFEKLNLLERETVQAMQSRMNSQKQTIEYHEHQTSSHQKYQQVLSQEKFNLQSKLISAETDLEITQNKWEQDRIER